MSFHNSSSDKYDRSGFDSDQCSNNDDYPSYYGYRYGNRRRLYYWERDYDSYSSWPGNLREEQSDTPSPPRQEPRIEPPKEELVKTFHVKEVNYHIDKNTRTHKTRDYFECSEKQPPELVVRRGDSFKLTIKFDRPFDKTKNGLKLVFTIGENATNSQGTKAVFDVDETGGKVFKCDEWGAILENKDGNQLSILVYISCDCIIGEWNFGIRTFSEGKGEDGKDNIISFYYEDEPIKVLFNPSSKYDTVYMDNPLDRKEYILNDSGYVHKRNLDQQETVIWKFGQFEEDILDTVLQLLRSGYKNGVSKEMSDPVKVSRRIAKLVNSSDDKGLMIAKWDGDYSDGTAPWCWTGSTQIIREWKRSGPVKYGQSWVFSAVTTTVCRALGIPCKSITNYSSPYETEQSTTIEKNFNEEDEPIELSNSDSVWNFHDWNEMYMSRPDLENPNTGFEYLSKPGWHTIDATPQERSDGRSEKYRPVSNKGVDVYDCGHSPVEAMNKDYSSGDNDSGFVFAEVNADITNKRDIKVKPIMKTSVGEKITTKNADGLPILKERDQDLTSEYKQGEGDYACGPSVEAENRDCSSGDNDTRFVFAEVNADQTEYHKRNIKVKTIMKNSVGEKITTEKADGLPILKEKDQLLDLTSKYKLKEGSTEERHAVVQALNTAETTLDVDFMNE